MHHLLVAGKLHPTGAERLRALEQDGVKITYLEEATEDSIAAHITTADALIIRTQPLTAETIKKAKQLKVVSRHGVGYDTVDLNTLNDQKIALTIVGDVNSISVAEHAMMQLLSGAKQLLRADRSVREPGKWEWRNKLEQQEISGKNLLIIGFGRAGKQLARMAAGFQMNIRAYDPYLQKRGWPDSQISPIKELHDGLRWADCLSLHVPKEDKPLLGPLEFSKMKPGMVISNTARGGIICEESLAKALKNGQVHAAGIDVLLNEPPNVDFALAKCDNALLSPHIAGLTEEASERMAISSIENAMNFLNGTIDTEMIVNQNALNDF